MKSFCTLSNGNRKHFYVCLINTIKTVLINTTGTDMRRFLVYFFSSYFGVVQLTKNSLISGDRHNAGWNQRWYLVRDRCRCVDKSDTSRRHYDTRRVTPSDVGLRWRRTTVTDPMSRLLNCFTGYKTTYLHFDQLAAFWRTDRFLHVEINASVFKFELD